MWSKFYKRTESSFHSMKVALLSWILLCSMVQQESGRQLRLIKCSKALRNKEANLTFYCLNLLYYLISRSLLDGLEFSLTLCCSLFCTLRIFAEQHRNINYFVWFNFIFFFPLLQCLFLKHWIHHNVRLCQTEIIFLYLCFTFMK